MRKIAIVSPSGKFYGSEQVLFDYLATTKCLYSIYVPNGMFYEKLKMLNIHSVYSFSSVKKLYGFLFYSILSGKYDGIYINEGGHINYIKLLAKIFPGKKFFVHIRLLEDCKRSRLGVKMNNVSYISVSEFISRGVFKETGIECTTIYDIYRSVSGIEGICMQTENIKVLRLGIIGRVTSTKGLKAISEFCDYCEKKSGATKLEFHFFGGADDHLSEVCSFLEKAQKYDRIKCLFHGFISDKANMYQSIDILIHFNKIEPLGRIILESLDYGIPFVAFREGGVGELAEKFGVFDWMIEDTEYWKENFLGRILFLFSNKLIVFQRYQRAKENMRILCHPDVYTKQLEHLFYD